MIVGAGQINQRESDPSNGRSPPALIAAAARLALLDSGARAGPRLLRSVRQISVANVISWPAPDPGAIVAAELGISGAETVASAVGGTSPLHLLAHACDRIADGEIEVALIVGCEMVGSLGRALRDGIDLGWPSQSEQTKPDRYLGLNRDPTHSVEQAAGLIAPAHYYSLFESAVRAGSGRDRQSHQVWLGELWARFSRVAAANQHAWIRTAPGAEEIATVSASNRPIAEPYTKLLSANIQLDQASTIIVSSQTAAAAAGVAAADMTYVRAAAAANDHWFAIERERLDRSPAVAACGREVMAHADLAIDEIDHLDLYSCFPSAVQIAAAELGIDLAEDERPPTVTGGLTFAGGPGNNYGGHALASMHQVLREGGGSGLLTGVGWYMTKHAAAILSAEPPSRPFEAFAPQAQVDPLPKLEPLDDFQGTAAIEACTVVYGRDRRPESATVTARIGETGRAAACCVDPAAIERLLDGEPLGREVEIIGAEFSV